MQNKMMKTSALLYGVNWNRKAWHLVGGMFAIILTLSLPWPYTFFAALTTLLTWVTVESMRRREPWFGRLFFTLSTPFIRHHERRKYVGNTWFALSITILTAIFHDPVLLAGSIVGWTFADPAAEVIGKLIPSKTFFDGEKSLAGTIGGFVVGFLAYWFFFYVAGTKGDILAATLTGAAATTFAEFFSFSFTVNDNFTIPLVTALALSYVLV